MYSILIHLFEAELVISVILHQKKTVFLCFRLHQFVKHPLCHLDFGSSLADWHQASKKVLVWATLPPPWSCELYSCADPLYLQNDQCERRDIPVAAAAVLGSWPGWQQKSTSASLVPYGSRLLCHTPCARWERIISAECYGEAAGCFRCLCVLILTLSLQCVCLVKSRQHEGLWHKSFLILDKLVSWEYYSSDWFYPMSPSHHLSFLLWAGLHPDIPFKCLHKWLN